MTGVIVGVSDASITRVCARTGLRLVRRHRPIYRVGKHQYGAIPVRRRTPGDDRAGWSRWDTVGTTVCAGDTPVAAFAETLAYLQPVINTRPLGEVFPDDGPQTGQAGLLDAIVYEMPGPGRDMYRKIVPGWRLDRHLYELVVSPDDWFVDVAASETVAALNAGFDLDGDDRLDLSDLAGPRRELTTGLADHLRTLTLDDGSQLRGVRYLSKHGADLEAYAMWLRRTDDGGHPAQDGLSCVVEHPVDADNEHLRHAAGLMGLEVG